MTDLTSKQTNFVSRAITVAESIVKSCDDLDQLKREWDELGYAAIFENTAFSGENSHLAIADLAALASAQTALKTLMDGGHRAKLLKFRR